MTLECPQCKSPVARERQQFCYRCGNDLRDYYESLEAQSDEPQAETGPPESKPPESGDLSPSVTQDGLPIKDTGNFAPAQQTMVIESLDITSDSGAPGLAAEEKAMLRILLPSGDAFDREIERVETQMGKGPRNDIVIADPAVSTSHALIRVDQGVYTVRDVGSRNGTFVNGERISEPRQLHHGDVIGLGLSRMTFRLSDHSETGAIDLADIQPPTPPPLTEDSLANAIIAEGMAGQADVERLRASNRRLYRALIEEGMASEESLCDLMSRLFQIPVIDLRGMKIGEDVTSHLHSRVATSAQIVPAAMEANRLTLAVADPTDSAAIEEVKTELRVPFDIRLATASEISEQIGIHYGPKLIGVLPSGEKLQYSINQPEIEIGKATHNHIVLTDPTVSNTHAVLLVRNGGYSIVDLGSRNGTFVNAERLGTQSYTLRHGDKIQLGQTVLTFRNPGETTENVTATLSPDVLEEVRRRAGIADPAAKSPGAFNAPPAPGAAVPPPANITPQAIPVPLVAPPAQSAQEPADTGDDEKGKKKKKKKKDDRLKAAYVGAASRIIAQVFAVLLSVGLALFVAQRSFGPAGNTPIDPGKKSKAKLSSAAAGTRFTGKYEPSAVVYVPDADGVLFVSDSRSDEVFWMQLDSSGNQVGEIKSVPLGVKIADPEGITYGSSFFYVIGSQSDPQAGDRNALVRFKFDAVNKTISEQAEIIPDIRSYLIANVPELKGAGERAGAQDGLNIEGIAWDPLHERLLLGLRSPLSDGLALIIPIKVRDLLPPFSTEKMAFAEPRTIKLNLNGSGIRDLQYDSRLNSFLIISGATETMPKSDFKLWEWNGDANQSNEDSKPREIATLDSAMKPEGVTRVKINGRDFVFIVGDANTYTRLNYSEE